jgi:hypothetical protein
MDEVALPEGFCNLGAVILAEGLCDWGRQVLPLFQLYPGICITTEKKAWKTSARVAG